MQNNRSFSISRRSISWLAVIATLALLALRVRSWGAPVQARYQIAVGPTTAFGTDAKWTIKRERLPGESWTARDTDGDGTWDEFSTPEGAFARPTSSSPKRWLVVCLDGVPVTVMQSLWDSGHFREFFRPTATVSTLPSDTEMALTTALHAGSVPGYEDRYFDRAKNSMRGGAWVTLSRYGVPYIRMLDYDPPGWSKAAPYVMMRKSYDADLGRFRAAFLRSHGPIFLAHITASDAFLHARTAQQAGPLLIEFDDVLRELYLDARGGLGIIAFSDHGNTQVPNHAVRLKTSLTNGGWRVSDSLHTPHDVAIPPYGLVGFAAIYCQPESVEQLAEDLRGVEGADVIVSRNPDSNTATIREAGSNAIAELEWSADGQRYRYNARVGDPLRLVDVFGRLRESDKLDSKGFASDADLFAATSSAHFPDAAARIHGWATGAEVRNPSDIIVSFRPGYFYGEGSFEYLVTIAGTHGGLEQSATLGFAMATFPLPAAVRVSDVIPKRLLESASARQRLSESASGSVPNTDQSTAQSKERERLTASETAVTEK
jgi:hypothetical protein